MKSIDYKISNGFARFVMDEKLTILDANNICASQLNLNKVNLRAGSACLSEVLSEEAVNRIKEFNGSNYGKTLEFKTTIISDVFDNGEGVAKTTQGTFQLSISRIHNDVVDNRDVYVIVLTNLGEIDRYNNQYEKTLFELEAVNDSAIKASVYLTSDAELTLYEGRERYYDYLGYTEYEYQQIIENKAIRTIYPPDREKLHSVLHKDGEDEIEFDIRVIDKQVRILWVNISAKKTNIINNGYPVYFCVIKDVSTAKTTLMELNKQKRFFELISTSLEGGTKICYNDKKFSFAYVGDELLNFLGFSYDEFMRECNGNMYDLIYEQDAEEAFEVINSWFLSGNYYEVEYRLRKSDGTIAWVMDKGNRIIDENGNEVCVGLIVDVDNTRKIIDKLEESNSELKKLQNSIPGSFGKVTLFEEEFVLRNGNAQFYELLGMDTNNNPFGISISYERLGISTSFVNEAALLKEENIEYVLYEKNTKRWFMIKATYSGENFGSRYPDYYVMVSDITQQKEAQFQIEFQREKYKMVADILEDIIFEYDCDSDVMIFSDKYKQIFGEGPMLFSFKEKLLDAQKNDNEDDIRGPKETNIDYLEIFNAIDNLDVEENYHGEYFVNYKKVNGRWYSATATGKRNENGKLVKIIGAIRDVDALKKEQKKLFDKSRHDSLSGLLNKIATQEEIAKKISEGLVEGASALLMIDIDDFKTVNDVYGHLIGDKVIIEIAKILKSSFREEDIVGRVGGDEFQVFMSGILERQMVVERVISIIEKVKKISDCIEEIPENNVAISVGIAFTSDIENYNILYNKADSALYSAKRNGKNRYEIYGQVTETEKNITGRHKSKSEEVVFEKVIEMAFSEVDFKRRVALIFDYVGYHMELFSIELFKYHERVNNLMLHMKWNLAGFSTIRLEESERAFVDFTSGKEYAIISDKNMLDYSFNQKIMIESSGISGAFQYVIIGDDRKIGAINFTFADKGREFSQKEVTKLLGIAKLIKLLVLNDMQSGHVINKEFKISSAIKNECEFILEVNPRSGEYDMYVSDENGIDEHVSHGDYASMMAKAISNRVDEKYKEDFSKTYELTNMIKHFASGESSISMEIVRILNGENVWTRVVALMPDLNPDTGKIYVYYYKVDPVRIEQIEESRKNRAINKQQTVVEEAFEEIFRLKPDEEFIYITGGAAEKLKPIEFNNDYNTLIKTMSEKVIHPQDAEEFKNVMRTDNLWESLKTNKMVKYDYRRLSNLDEYMWTEYRIVAIKDGTTNKEEFVIMTSVIENPVFYANAEEMVESNNTILRNNGYINLNALSGVDTLTGVYNIQYFYDKTRQMMDENPDKKFAIIRVDIDKFKLINDLYGFSEGDKVLRFLASVIRSEMQGKGTYGRINSDIFCMCITYKTIGDIIHHIEQLIMRFADHHMRFKFVPFFGIYMVDDTTVDIGIMCDWANLALKTIKGNQISRYAFYDTRLRKNILDEKMFENEMEHALASGQFEAYIQPQYDIASAAVISAEALIRWNHPVEGVMSPGRFIPVFERNGFIVKVDEFIWEEACKVLRKIIDSGWSPVPISVNVSRLHMYDEHLCEKLVELMNKYSLPHRLLVLEVTETVYFDDAELMNRILVKLRNSGFSIAMDDFGSGFSSLNMLQDMKIDELKIDREFLSKSTLTKEGKTIVKYIIAMAHDLKLQVVAEGVETAEQAAFLLEAECNIAQGYYYSRPVPTDKFIEIAFNPRYQKKIDEEIERVKRQMQEGKVAVNGEEANI